MQDIGPQLAEIMREKKCSALLAFMMIKNGLYIQESESNKESGGRLCHKRNIDTDR